MQTTIEPYSLLLLWRDGAVVAAQRETKTVIRDDQGNLIHERPNPAEPIPADLGTEILGQVNAGLLARIGELETQIEHLTTEHAQALDALRAEHAAEIAALQSSPAPSPSVLTTLGSVYDTLPEDVQFAFAPVFAIVRVLVQAGRNDLAAAHVAGLVVPDNLIATRDQIVSLLQS